MDADTTLASKILPSRRAAQAASSSISRQLVDSDLSEPEPDATPSSKPTSNSRTTKVHTPIAVSRIPKLKPSSSTPRIEPSEKTRQLAPFELGLDELSDLSALSSLSCSPEPEQRPNTEKSSVPPWLTPLKSTPSLSGPSDSPGFLLRQNLYESTSWSLTSLDTYVWVLVDLHARVFEPDSEYPCERIWWPGKITTPSSLTRPIRVKLYGSLSSGAPTTLTVKSPSSQNILSMTTSLGSIRFDSPTFVDIDSTCIEGSPRKKHKRDRGLVEDRWRTAVSLMLRDKEDEDDGLPDVGIAFNDFACSAASAPRATEHLEEIGYLDEDEFWEPPGPDINIHIPGEPILAIHLGTYWPARVLGYMPPANRKVKQGRYAIEYLDGKKATVYRSRFYIMEEEGFGTCKVGEFESAEADVDIVSDGEEDITQLTPRFPSPLPTFPPPSPTTFVSLPVRNQFAYIKPILQAILGGSYSPAKQKHDNFIKGGKARQTVVDDAAMRGRLDPQDVRELQECLVEWCLREERFAMKKAEESKLREGDTFVDLVHTPTPSDTIPVFSPATEPPSSFISENIGNLQVKLDDHEVASQNSTLVRGSSNNNEQATTTPPSDSETTPSPPTAPASGTDKIVLAMLHSDVPVIQESYVRGEGRNLDDVDPVTNKENGLGDPLGLETEYINRQMLQSAESTVEAHAPDPSYLPRQKGCDAYESLSQVGKIDYCLNVLLPEAIIQLLLWQSGERTTMEILSPEREEELHRLGNAKRAETDWVRDVMRARKQVERVLAKKGAGKWDEKEAIAGKGKSVGETKRGEGGTRTRPGAKRKLG